MSRKVKLGEIASFQTGPFGTQLKASEYSVMGTPVINVKNIGYGNLILNDMDYVPDTVCSRLKNHLLKEGDIVFGRKGSVDRHCYIKEENENWMQGSDCIRVRLSNEVNARYISYYLMLDRVKKQINNASIGSTMASINTDILKTVEIVLPCLEKQNLIVDLLSKIDEKIENNNKVNSELESMAKTIFDYWFLQFDFPDENGKPYKSSGGRMVWNEELKKQIPEGWDVKRIGSVLGKVPKTKKYLTAEYKETGKYPIIDQSKKYICGYTNEQENLIEFDDAIVFGDHTKEIKYVNFPFARGADGTQILVSKNEALSNYFLYLQICQMNLVDQGYSRYFKFLKDKNILVPFKAINDSFIKIVSGFTFKIRINHIENQELVSLRDFLLPLLMNGQICFQ